MLATISALHAQQEIVPGTPDMLGKNCEVVVLAFDPKNLNFKPDVWQTAGPDPWQAKTLVLSE